MDLKKYAPHLVLISLFVMVFSVGTVQAQITLCTPINNFPSTISTSGVYCLTADYDSSATSGNMITINANNVVLDLNDHRITGFGGGADTQSYNIKYLSSGCGYWGCGTYGSPTSNSFTGNGELHGVIELLGTYQTVTFTDTTPEFWHGLTVGVTGLAAPVPEPETYAMMLAGLGLMGFMVRRKKSV